MLRELERAGRSWKELGGAGCDGASKVKQISRKTEAGGKSKPGGKRPSKLAKETDLSYRWWRVTECVLV